MFLNIKNSTIQWNMALDGGAYSGKRLSLSSWSKNVILTPFLLYLIINQRLSLLVVLLISVSINPFFCVTSCFNLVYNVTFKMAKSLQTFILCVSIWCTKSFLKWQNKLSFQMILIKMPNPHSLVVTLFYFNLICNLILAATYTHSLSDLQFLIYSFIHTIHF
jgi:hypothetical protein